MQQLIKIINRTVTFSTGINPGPIQILTLAFSIKSHKMLECTQDFIEDGNLKEINAENRKKCKKLSKSLTLTKNLTP